MPTAETPETTPAAAEAFVCRSLDPREILSSAAEGICSVLNPVRCSVVRLDVERHPGRAFVFTALDDPAIEGYSLDLESYPEIVAAIDENRVVVVRDREDDPIARRIRERHRTLPFPLSLVLPIGYGARQFGVLFLRFDSAHVEMREEAIGLCRAIAAGAALALSNAAEYEELIARVEHREHEARSVEEAQRLRMEVLSAASHDLRTPLNSILGYSELLVEGAYGDLPPEARDVVGNLADNAHSLLQIVNTLIDHARLEEGKIQIVVTSGEVAALLEELRITIEPLTNRRPVRVRFHGRGPLPPLETDWLKLKRILLNLLHNALKFTDEGEISLTVSAEPDRLVFEVRDSGAGIAPEELGKIFEQFYRVNPKREEGPGGLGLTIVKRYSEMLHGELSVESRVGAGTTFRLRLPTRWPGFAPEA